jgi:hypothetical protein
MDDARRTWLRRIAVERLRATADDTEPWSFLFRTEGAEGFHYCPWSWTSEEDFDGEVDIYDLPWPLERKALIRAGLSDPTGIELEQWREAKCRWAANGSDWCYPAWVVPLQVEATIGGYAIFLCEDSPSLEDVYDTPAEAKDALKRVGAVDSLP